MQIQQSNSPSGAKLQQHEALHRAISDCAYHLWEAKGRPTGCADEIWLEAERLIRRNGAEITERHAQASGTGAKADSAVAGGRSRRAKQQPGSQ